MLPQLRTALSNEIQEALRSRERKTMPNVLIVDDDLHARLILGKHVRRLGCEVLEAKDGFEALALLFNSDVSVDLVITDVWMPGMSGIDLLKAIRERNPDLPIAMISARATLNSSLEAINSGAYAYVTKPYRHEDVEQVVARGLQRNEETRARRALGSDFERFAALEDRIRTLNDTPSESLRDSDLLSGLIAGLRHELGNIVSGIILNLEVLRRSGNVPAELNENLEDLHASANDLIQLITRFKEYPQPEMVAQIIDLREVVTNAVDIARNRDLSISTTLHYEGSDESIFIRGAAPELSRALLHLIENGLEAARRRVVVNVSATPTHARVQIEDDGRGFDASVLANAFSPAATTKLRDGFMQGLGFGLFITRAVIALHGGTVTLSNLPDGGACAIVEFPVVSDFSLDAA
ncbi:MAG: hypothetical protein OHK0023_09870 [Anaerolineae bacterium]